MKSEVFDIVDNNSPHNPMMGALWMVLAGITFAFINTFTQWMSQGKTITSTSIAFYQYLFALFFLLPALFKEGLGVLKTKKIGWHILRVAFSVAGVQFWIYALAYPIPIWQGIALLMTSPLFAMVGSGLILKEKVGMARWIATLIGFAGAMIILEPWADDFQWIALTPLAAAFFWAAYSLMVKKLSGGESPNTIVVYLFLLITPFNFFIDLPNLHVPNMQITLYLVLLGLLTMFAQVFIARAYAAADASYVQPFDYLKLPLNVLGGFLVFGWVPPGRLWLGATLIIAVSFYITRKESKNSIRRKIVEQKN